MGTVIIVSVVLVGIAVFGLSIALLFSRKKQFPDTHIGRNKAMRDRGIHCASSTDRLERENYIPTGKTIRDNQHLVASPK